MKKNSFPNSKIVMSAMLVLYFMSAIGSRAQSAQVTLTKYKVGDHALAEELKTIDDEFEDREDPIKATRRSSPFGSEAYEKADGELQTLRKERDQKLWEALQSTEPVLAQSVEGAIPGDIDETKDVDGAPFHLAAKLGKQDGMATAEISAEHDGKTLYQGSALLIPLDAPFVLNMVFVKISGQRQGSLVFIEIEER